MGRRSLSSTAAVLLREVLERQRPELLPLLGDVESGRVLSAEGANDIRDAVGDEMMATGFDADGEGLNERGLRLDDLIDDVARVSLLHGGIWVFNDGTGGFAGGVFTSKDEAEAWIAKNELSGVLTLYPLDTGVYEWAIDRRLFALTKDSERAPSFIGRFNTASQQHVHYEAGRRSGRSGE